MIKPLLSDGFSETGTSDGLGHPEANGGSGKTWVNWRGTWGVSGGLAQATALHGDGDAVAVVDAGKADIILTATLARAAGNIGVIIRGRDSGNYLMIYWDGTRIQEYYRARGGAPVYIAQSGVLDAGALALKLTINHEDSTGSRYRIYWNDVIVASDGRVNLLGELEPGTRVGLYTTDLGNTVDNLVVHATGRDGEYQWMDQNSDNNQDWISAEKYIVFDGNSLIAGSLVTDVPYKVIADLGSPWAGTNVGVGGRGGADMIPVASQYVDIHYNARRVKNILVYWEGRNDLTTLTPAQAYANTQTYCLARQAIGWKVIVLTLSLATGDGETRTDYDDLLIAGWSGFADAIARIDQDPEIGDAGDPTDPVYYQVGGVHLTPAGYAIVATLIEAAIAGL
jgi:hypothetical protein